MPTWQQNRIAVRFFATRASNFFLHVFKVTKVFASFFILFLFSSLSFKFLSLLFSYLVALTGLFILQFLFLSLFFLQFLFFGCLELGCDAAGRSLGPKYPMQRFARPWLFVLHLLLLANALTHGGGRVLQSWTLIMKKNRFLARRLNSQDALEEEKYTAVSCTENIALNICKIKKELLIYF